MLLLVILIKPEQIHVVQESIQGTQHMRKKLVKKVGPIKQLNIHNRERTKYFSRPVDIECFSRSLGYVVLSILHQWS